MEEKRIKEAFLEMETPDLKEEILSAIHTKRAAPVRRKLHPALIAAALLLILTAVVGAAAGGTLRLKSGSRYYFRDENGLLVQPSGFYTEQDADVQLSGQALANIAPYVFAPSPEQAATVFETASRAEMEALLDMPLHLPDAMTGMATGYRLWATGENGDAVSIRVQIQLNGDWGGDYLDVYLRGRLPTFLTDDEPEMSAYSLPAGGSASLAISRSSRNRDWLVHSLYTRDGAVYHLCLRGENKKDTLHRTEEILDTLK